jgi:hypothetical protein
MWGPAAALSDENLLSCERGLTPRVFERLFSRINEVFISFFVLKFLNKIAIDLC